jgi:hypothetical protein
MLVNGKDEPASEMLYLVRGGLDSLGRSGVYTGHGLVASQDLVEKIVAAIGEDPRQISTIFHGALPQLEGKYKERPNGKILILEKGQVESKDLDKLVIAYQ